MSTILDALRKSEQERKLNNIPTLSDMPAPKESSRWPFIAISLIIGILFVVAGILLYHWLSTPNTTASEVLPITNKSVAKDTVADTEIIVNVVSFSEQDDQRFAMINGKLYREGEFVRAGLRVEQILADSVVLNQRGRRITRKP